MLTQNFSEKKNDANLPLNINWRTLPYNCVSAYLIWITRLLNGCRAPSYFSRNCSKSFGFVLFKFAISVCSDCMPHLICFAWISWPQASHCQTAATFSESVEIIFPVLQREQAIAPKYVWSSVGSEHLLQLQSKHLACFKCSWRSKVFLSVCVYVTFITDPLGISTEMVKWFENNFSFASVHSQSYLSQSSAFHGSLWIHVWCLAHNRVKTWMPPCR